MKIDVLTLFPEMLEPLKVGIIGRALNKGIFTLNVTDFREFSKDKHKHVDDYSFGGGAGMIIAPQPVADAVNAVDSKHEAKRIYLSPRGRVFNQTVAKELVREERLLFLCGCYEGVDQRVLDKCFDDEISIGDFIMTCGEIGALAVINTTVRLLSGVLGSEESLEKESFDDNLLEYPQYTRPAVWEGIKVPEVLLSGDHAEVDKWRQQKRIEITKERRPELLKKKK